MSERWDPSRRFHAGVGGQNLESLQPITQSPVPCPDHGFYYHGPSYSHPVNSSGSANPLPFNRVEESHPNPFGNMDDFSHTGLSNGRPVAAQEFGYGGNISDDPYTTSYNSMYHSEDKFYEHVVAATGSSLYNLQLDRNNYAQVFESSLYSRESPSVGHSRDAAGPSHIPGGTTWPSSDSGYRYDTTYPHSTTNNSTESVPDLNERSRIIKQVVATDGVVDASNRRRRLTKPGRLYKCTGFPPCQATFTTSHNLKSKIVNHMFREAR